MHNTPTLLISLLMLLGLTACYPITEAKGGVAVLDLQKVASSLGRDEDIAAAVKAEVEGHQATLVKIRDGLRAEIAKRQQTLGEKPREEDSQKLQQAVVQAERRLRQEIAAADKKANQHRVQLIIDFRTEIEPTARRIANDRNLSLVMLKRDLLLYVDPTVDITNAVIDALQSR